jgi:peptidoglycan/LPS O-acetylase OafA/YrhL
MATHTYDGHASRRDRLHVPRSKGATSGLLLVLLGIWGALIPFVGPIFGYAYTPDDAWHFTWDRFWLEILPGAATFLGGLWLLGTSNRISGWIGAWLAVAGGTWFVIGRGVSQLWNDGVPAGGVPAATSTLGRTVEEIGFFTGLGCVIIFLAASALGRMSVVGVRDLAHREDYHEQYDGSGSATDSAEHRRTG